MKFSWVTATVMVACVAGVVVLAALGRGDVALVGSVVSIVLNAVLPQLAAKGDP